jgi:FkbM family methyltransferase
VFEPQTTKLFVHLAKKTKNIVIGGVYSGDHAVLVAKVMDKKGLIHGFEADPEQIALLKKNATANKVANKIKAIPVGVWSYDTKLKLVGEDAFAHAVPLKGKAKKNDIVFPAISIENYTKKKKIDQIDLIQMDIEGSELPALKGAMRFLSQPVGQAPNIIFEVHRYYVDWSKGLGQTEIIKFLRKHGYHVYSIRDFQSNVPMKGCKIELIEPEKTYLEGPPHGFNMLAVKDKSILKPSVFRFVKNVSPKLLLHKNPALHWPTEWR